jgi:hypothetical protein
MYPLSSRVLHGDHQRRIEPEGQQRFGRNLNFAAASVNLRAGTRCSTPM